MQVVNVLPPKFFRGEENPFENKRVGHISSSVNVPIEDSLVDDNRGMLRPAPELRVVVDNAGLSPEHETDVHCQAGARTAFGYFVLSVLGYDRVRAYDAAMAEWANRDDTPLTLEPA
jgi:thiosulfate/3-mercaptopyruvate sulfurtransferase